MDEFEKMLDKSREDWASTVANHVFSPVANITCIWVIDNTDSTKKDDDLKEFHINDDIQNDASSLGRL